LNEQLRRELSDLIRTQLRDPRVGPVTVTAVEVAQDLGSARVYVRTLSTGEEAAEALRGLEAAAPFLRGRLGRVLKIRRIPELRFREDRSMAQAQRIEEVLADVLPEERAAADDEEVGGGSGAAPPAREGDATRPGWPAGDEGAADDDHEDDPR
jgi:ribosome-binding factor A